MLRLKLGTEDLHRERMKQADSSAGGSASFPQRLSAIFSASMMVGLRLRARKV